MEDKRWIDHKTMLMDEAKADESTKCQDGGVLAKRVSFNNTDVVLSQASSGAFATSLVFTKFYHLYAALGDRS